MCYCERGSVDCGTFNAFIDNSSMQVHEGFSDASPRSVKRVAKACGECARLKTACDTNRPCSRCVHRGIGDCCFDRDSEPFASSPKSSRNAPGTQTSDSKRAKRGSAACLPCFKSKTKCIGDRPCQRCLKKKQGHLCVERTPRRKSSSGSGRKSSRPTTLSVSVSTDQSFHPHHSARISLPGTLPFDLTPTPLMPLETFPSMSAPVGNDFLSSIHSPLAVQDDSFGQGEPLPMHFLKEHPLFASPLQEQHSTSTSSEGLSLHFSDGPHVLSSISPPSPLSSKQTLSQTLRDLMYRSVRLGELSALPNTLPVQLNLNLDAPHLHHMVTALIKVSQYSLIPTDTGTDSLLSGYWALSPSLYTAVPQQSPLASLFSPGRKNREDLFPLVRHESFDGAEQDSANAVLQISSSLRNGRLELVLQTNASFDLLFGWGAERVCELTRSWSSEELSPLHRLLMADAWNTVFAGALQIQKEPLAPLPISITRSGHTFKGLVHIHSLPVTHPLNISARVFTIQ